MKFRLVEGVQEHSSKIDVAKNISNKNKVRGYLLRKDYDRETNK